MIFERIKYDYLFVTNLPSFYKINLYNEVAKIKKIKVIFISNKSVIRNSDFIKGDMNFDYEVITNVEYEKRNKFNVFIKLFLAIFKVSFSKILFSGWESIESNFFMFLLPKKKNSIVIESSILECKVSGFIGLIKKIIVNRNSLALPAGKLQEDLLHKLKFKGKIKLTHGVGILNEGLFKSFKRKEKNKNLKRFIFIGRLSSEKNVDYIINAFNVNCLPLTIVGDGPLLDELKNKANSNIVFLGYVDNSKLNDILYDHDVFILPSLSEVWGLVIEEAIYSTLPVLVSENVGCKFDLVEKLNTGLVFPLNNINELNDKIKKIGDNYDWYYNNVCNLNYNDRINLQIAAYIE